MSYPRFDKCNRFYENGLINFTRQAQIYGRSNRICGWYLFDTSHTTRGPRLSTIFSYQSVVLLGSQAVVALEKCRLGL